MSNGFCYHNTEFDQFAADYDSALEKGISVSGENRSYFARGRVSWFAQCLRSIGHQPKSAIDFGCGTGASIPFLMDLIGLDSVVGVDTSAKCLEVAKRDFESELAQFFLFDQYEPRAAVDIAFCNGVFHHIPPKERDAAIDYINRSLRSGGLFALWENNPWNPGTRYVMSRIPFDRDAVPLTPTYARRLLQDGGFEIVSTDFLFIFPRLLRWMRWIEPHVSSLPFGAQYQVLCRKI